ncbi:filamentous hemagglutinin N-terminal domain-containing protein [Falsiroseomonas sp. CW058]|uniref:two-partner secretion domain-containing protein n=1 Tax=Falsiroseomonas sp. CW058 TaxID=3388664 RepID=UPI003D31728F
MGPVPASVRGFLLGTTALLPVLAGPAAAQAPNAQPTGGRVVAGQASIARTPAQTTVTQRSDRAAIDWQRFDVGRDQTVQFQQPNAGSWTLNRVTTPDPSLIAGRIQSNGGVAIVNQSGIVFAQGASVNVGALIASAANITNEAFMAGRMEFTGAPRPGARVENHGTVTVADRGLAAFVAPGVSNTGTIRGRLARVALAGAETFTLDMAGDGLLSIDVTGAVRGNGAALVTNSGTIEAPGGSVLLSANAASGLVEDVVRNSGRISANTDAATGRTGQVALRGGGGGVRIEGVVEAAGAAPGTRGGRVEAAGRSVTVAQGARVDASGTAGGGEARLGGATTDRVRVEGQVAAAGTGATARGGLVTVQAKDGVAVAGGAKLDASGGAGGGAVLAGTTGIGRAQQMSRETVVERGATIAADATARGDGGLVVVNGTEATSVRGRISARGGASGGDGGFIEVSGMAGIDLPGLSLLDVGAAAGRAGTVLLDPQFITIVNGTLVAAQGDVAAGDNGDATAGPPPGFSPTLTIRNADINASAVNLVLEATDGITVQAGATISKAAGDLTLRTTTNSGTVTVNGDITLAAGLLSIGSGSITLNSTVEATGLALTARTGIDQAGGLIRHAGGAATPLAVSARTTVSGAVTLARAGNGSLSFDTGAGSSGAVSLASAGTITLSGTVEATSLSLVAGTGISQAGGAVRHASGANTALTVTARTTTSGDVLLTDTSNGALSFGTGGLSAGAVSVTTANNRDLVIGSALQATGGVTLASGRDVSVAAALTSGGDVVLTAGRDVSVAAALTATGRTVSINAARDIGQTAAGVITAATLNARGEGGTGTEARAVALGTALNVVGAVAEMRAQQSAILRSSANMSVGTVVIGGANGTLIDLQGNGGLTLTGALDSNGQTIILRTGDSFDAPAGSGNITQAVGSTVATGWFGASAAGSLAVDQPGNAIAWLGRGADLDGTAATRALTAGGAASLRTGVDLQVFDPVSAANLTVAAPTLTLDATASLAVGSGGALTLRADDMLLSGRIRAPAGTITVAGVTAGRDVFLGADRGGGDPAGLYLNAAELALFGGNGAAGATDPATRLRVTTTGDVRVPGDISLRNRVGALLVDGSATGYDLGGAGIDVARLVVRAGAGNVSATHANNRIDELAVLGTGGAGSSVNVASGGSGVLAVVSDLSPAGTTSGISGFGTVTLGAAGLAIEAPVAATGGAGSVALTATGAAGITQGSGGHITAATLTASATTAGAGIVLNAGGSATVANWNRVSSLGASTAGGAFALVNDGALLVGGALSAGGALGISTTGTLTLGATVGAQGDLTLRAPALVQNAGAAVSAHAAGATVLLQADVFTLSGTPSVTATGGGTTIALQPFSANTGLTFGAAGGLQVTAAQVAQLSADTVSLRASGTGNVAIADVLDIGAQALDLRGAGIAQTGGEINAAGLTFTATGAVTLNRPANTIGGFSGTTAGAVVLVTDGAATLGAITGASITAGAGGLLTVSGALLANTGAIGLTGAGVALGANVTASGQAVTVTATGAGNGIAQSAGIVTAGALVLDAAAGIAQTGGEINAAGLTFTATGAVTLNRPANTIGSFAGTTAGAVVLVTDGAATLGAITGASITAGAGGLLTVSGAQVANTGAIGLTGAGVAIGANLTASGQAVTVTATGAGNGIAQGAGIVTAGALVLDAAAGIAQTGGEINAAGLTFTATGAVTLNRPANTIGGFAGTTAGAVVLVTDGAATLGAITGASITAGAGGLLTVSGAQVANSGAIGLTGAGVSIGANVTASGQAVTVTATGAGNGIAQSAGIVTAGALVLDAAAGIAQAGGSLSAVSLAMTAGGAITLDNGAPAATTGLNAVGSLGAVTVGGAFTLRNAGTFSIDGAVTGPGGIQAGAVTLHSQGGNITFGVAGRIGAGIAGSIGAMSLTLTAPNGNVSVPGAISTQTGVTIRAGGAIGVGGAIANATSGGITLVSPGAMTLGGALTAAGQRVTMATNATVAQPGGIVTAQELVVTGAGGTGTSAASIDLGGANAIRHVVEARATGAARLRTTTALDIGGAVRAGANGTLRVEAGGALTVNAAGSVQAGTSGAGTGVVSLWGSSIDLRGPVQAGAAIALIASGGVDAFASIAANPAATITQSGAGTLTAPALATAAGGAVTLDLAGNSYALVAFAGAGNGDVTLERAAGTLTIGGVAGLADPTGSSFSISGVTAGTGTVTLTADDLAIGGIVRGGTVVLRPYTAGTGFALGVTGTEPTGVISLTTAEVANIRSTTLRIDGSAGSGSAISLGALDLRTGGTTTRVARILDLRGASVTQLAGGELSVERLTAAATAGSVLLNQGGTATAAGNTLNILGPVSATGDISIVAGGVPNGGAERRAPTVLADGTAGGGTQALRLAGAVNAGGALTLRTDGLALAGGSLRAGNGSMTIGTFGSAVNMLLGAGTPDGAGLRLGSDIAGALTLAGGGTRVLTLLAPSGDLRAAGAFDLGPSGAQRLVVQAGSVSSAAGSALSVADLDITAATGGADLTQGAHAVGTLRIEAPSGATTGIASTLDLTVLGVSTPASGRVGSVSLTGNSIGLAGAVRADLAVLAATGAGGAITQSAPLDAGRLDLRTSNGAVTLTHSGNAIGWLRSADLRNPGLTEGAALTLSTTANLSLDRDGMPGVFAGTVELTATGFGPAAPGGTQAVVIRAIGTGSATPFLDLTATAGGISLGTGSDLAAVGGTVALAATGNITTSGTSIAAGTVLTVLADGAASLTGGSLGGTTSVEVRGAASTTMTEVGVTGGNVTLHSTGGAVTLAGAAGLTAVAATGEVLVQSAAGGALAVTDMAIGAAGNLDLLAGGALTLTRGSAGAPGHRIRAHAATALQTTDLALSGEVIDLRAGSTVSVTGGSATASGSYGAAAGAAATLQSTTIGAAGALAISAGTTLTLAASTLSGTPVTLGGGTGLAIAGGSVASGGAATLAGGSGDVVLGGATLAATGVLGIGTAARLAATDAVLTGASIALQGGARLEVTGGSATAGAGLTAGTEGAAVLARTRLAAGAALAVTAAGALQATGTTFSGTTALVGGGGGLSLTGGGVTAGGALTLAGGGGDLVAGSAAFSAGGAAQMTAGGALRLTASDVTAASLAGTAGAGGATVQSTTISVAGAIGLTSGGAMQVVGSTLNGGTVALRGAGGLTLSGGGVATPGAFSARSDAGAVAFLGTQVAAGSTLLVSAGGDLRINPSRLSGRTVTLTAAGGATLVDSSVTAAQDIALTSGGGFAISGGGLSAGGAVSVDGRSGASLRATSLDAETAAFRTTGALTAGGVTARIGTRLLLAAEGGLASSGAIAVSPRAAGQRIPAVVLDTRAGAATSALPLVVQADLPGTVPTAQPTQMRAAPRSQAPGAFGQALDVPAAAMAFSILAPDSPVFLLADGARITGTIVAARLGVHGTGGAATLTGTLAGRDGIAAAEYGDLTRPVLPAALQQYRLNGCVLSAVNCVVLPPVMVVPSRLAADVVVALDRQRARNPDVVVPDVAQEDF